MANISDEKREALAAILLNFHEDSYVTSTDAIKGILGVLGYDDGMTLRDQFAMAIMATLLKFPKQDRRLLAESAYFYADGMMEYRKR